MTTPFADEASLSITIDREGRTARIAVGGEVDVTALAAMAAAAAQIHPAHDCVIIDLGAVAFIDLRGFEHVITTCDALAATGCRVELATTGMTDLMLEVMQLVSPS